MAFEGAAGGYDIVIDYAGEGRLSVDGGDAQSARIGDALRPPHLGGARRARRRPARHRASHRHPAGVAGFALYVLRRGWRARACVEVRFVDPARARGTTPPASRRRRAPVTVASARAARRLLRGRHRPAYRGHRRRAGGGRPAARAPAVRAGSGAGGRGRARRSDRAPPASPATRRAARCAPRSPSTPTWRVPGTIWRRSRSRTNVPRDAIEAGRAAARAAPGWWAPQLLLARAFTARGLDFDANRAVEAAAAQAGAGDGARLDDASLSGDRGVAAAGPGPPRARARRRGWRRRWCVRRQRRGARRADAGARRSRGRDRARCARRCALEPERDDLAGDLARLLSAAGRHDDALAEMARLVARDPNDPQRRLRLADAQAAAGQATAARETIAALLAGRPDVPEVQRAARALGVPLPLDGFRVDGRAIIRAFEAAAARYTAPAVMVLDRAVMRIFPERHGDDADSPDRARRQQGRRRQVGRDRDSAGRRDPEPAHPQARRFDARARGDRGQGDDLGGGRRDRRLHRMGIPGHAPAVGGVRARLPGRPFLLPVVRRADGAQRALAGVARRRRPGAGCARRRAPAADARRGRRHARHQLSGGGRAAAVRGARGGARDRVRARRCARPPAWTGARWARYLGEEFHDALRSSPELREQARRIARAGPPGRPARAGGGAGRLGDREHRGDRRARRSGQLRAGARPGQPDRAGAGAGARAGDPGPARCWRARAWSPTRRRPTPPQELDDFADALVELDVGAAGKPVLVYADLRLRHAAFGYLPPGLDGARMLRVPDGGFGFARKTAAAGSPHRRHDHPPRRAGRRRRGRHRGAGRLAGAGVGGAGRALRRRSGAAAPGLRAALAGRAVPGGAAARAGDRRARRAAPAQLGTARVRYSFSSARLAVPTGRTRGGRGRDAHRADVLPLATRAPLRGRTAARDRADAGVRRADAHDRDGGAAGRPRASTRRACARTS